jgi:hypothetical protein
MRTVTVRRRSAQATLTIDKDPGGRITRAWSGDADLARDCERAIERYRRDMPDGPTLDLPPVRIEIARADVGPLAHRMLCVAAIERYVAGAEVVDPLLPVPGEETDVVY